jgi:hypothetical protein
MLKSLLPLLLLVGCVAEESELAALPIDQAGPVGTLTLRVTPLVPGQPVTFTVTGADANQAVGIYRSSNVAPGGACIAALSPNCLDLRNPAVRQFNPVANGAGVASISVTLPNPLPLTSVAWQAAYRNGGGYDASTSALYTVHQPTSDNDFDGLTAVEEVATFGTDPGDGDSDGGGASDGLEIDRGTDPTDPGDDPATPTYNANISPMVDARCTGCHTQGGASGGRNFDDYADFFVTSSDVPSMDEIEPGLPGQSYMYHKLAGTHASVGGAGVRMPRGGPFFSAADLQMWADWIIAGAPQ